VDGGPQFMIVGTARSGTTLVQRLACELPGVIVPPETHLLSDLLPDLANRERSFPLAEPALSEELERYCRRPYMRGVALDPAAVTAAVGGVALNGVHLFGGVVRALAGDDATIVGEKTPDHLLWWEPLARALPQLRLVIVVRDPRAVHASFAAAGWGGGPVLDAQRWRADVRVVRAAVRSLGDRALLLRYEDVVTEPAGAREALRRHLGAECGTATIERSLFPEWETWKAPASGSITSAGVERWRQVVSPRDSTAIAAICRHEMGWLGYAERPTTLRAWAAQLAQPPWTQVKRVRRHARRIRRERAVQRLSRDWGSPEGHPPTTGTEGRLITAAPGDSC
jgi:hypothetical protein